MQLLVLPGLSRDENLWLRSLGSRVPDMAEAERLLGEYEKHKEETLYRSVMDLIVHANMERFQEVTDVRRIDGADER